VRTEVDDAGTNPILAEHVTGPYQVALNDDHILLLRVGDEKGHRASKLG
jgi:hypothetical protein